MLLALKRIEEVVSTNETWLCSIFLYCNKKVEPNIRVVVETCQCSTFIMYLLCWWC